MIEEHHGKMHESGNALLSLANKIEDSKSQIDKITKIQTTIAHQQNQIQAINSYITKLKDQIEEIENRDDDVGEKTNKLKELKEY